MYNNERCPKENIQQLVDGLVEYIKNFSILNPQNNKYYHTQEEVQDFVNKLYGLYKTGTRRVNQLMEEKMVFKTNLYLLLNVGQIILVMGCRTSKRGRTS